jgi:FkbM family methyltransferase
MFRWWLMARRSPVANVSSTAAREVCWASWHKLERRVRSAVAHIAWHPVASEHVLAATSDRRLQALQMRLISFKDRLARTRRRVLDARLLEAIFPFRAATARARAAIPPPERREAALRAASSAYVDTCAGGGAADKWLYEIELQGLRWWVPVPQPGGEPAPVLLAKQHFPYSVLTQTRELALGGLMIDVGANIGRTSISRVVLGDVVAAYCAEPDPINYAALVRNVIDNRLQGLVLPDRLAIGDRNGTVLLSRSRRFGGHRVEVRRRDGARGDGRLIEVPCLTLDTWLERLRVDPDAVTFIKVDVQGYELHVLRGAPRQLARRQIAWQLEIDRGLLAAAGASVAELYAMIERHFTHFIDLNGAVAGPRSRPVRELAEALAYVGAGRAAKTDIIVYSVAR